VIYPGYEAQEFDPLTSSSNAPLVATRSALSLTCRHRLSSSDINYHMFYHVMCVRAPRYIPLCRLVISTHLCRMISLSLIPCSCLVCGSVDNCLTQCKSANGRTSTTILCICSLIRGWGWYQEHAVIAENFKQKVKLSLYQEYTEVKRFCRSI
jgi:hypothetical protein